MSFERPRFMTSFYRAQVSSALTAVVDFSTLAILVELVGLWYVPSVAIAATLGAIVHFTLGRQWSYMAYGGHPGVQAFRYAAVSFTAMLLTVALVYMLTDGIGLPYMMSRVAVALLICWMYSFPLHRYYVFR